MRKRVAAERLFALGRGCSGGSDLGAARLGHAKIGLAMLAFHKLAARLFRHSEELPATKIGTDHLDSHSTVSAVVIGPKAAGDEEIHSCFSDDDDIEWFFKSRVDPDSTERMRKIHRAAKTCLAAALRVILSGIRLFRRA
jgi:hypothetical protein